MKFPLRFTLAIAAVATLGHADDRAMERAMLRIESMNEFEEIWRSKQEK